MEKKDLILYHTYLLTEEIINLKNKTGIDISITFLMYFFNKVFNICLTGEELINFINYRKKEERENGNV